MLELETATKAKLTDVGVLSSKNRPVDANPGVALAFTYETTNEALVMFDGRLRGALYTKDATLGSNQSELNGVPPVSDTPNLTAIGRKLGRFAWDQEQTGMSLTFVIGTGRAASNIELEAVTVDSIHVQPKEGGTVIVSFKAECQDVTEKVFGKLATLKNRDVEILLAQGDAAQGQVDTTSASKEDRQTGMPFQVIGKSVNDVAPAAGKSAGDVFVAQHGNG